MFSFKAANPNKSVFRGVISMLLGITIILLPGFAQKYIVQIIGGILIVNGLINFLVRTFRRETTQSAFEIVPKGVMSILFGVILLIFPAFIMKTFIVIIGFILIIAGGSQLSSQLLGRRVVGFSWIFFVIGLIAFLSGFLMLTKPFESAETLMVFFGAIVTLYGVGEILWSFKLRKHLKQQPRQEPHTIDAEYEEVN